MLNLAMYYISQKDLIYVYMYNLYLNVLRHRRQGCNLLLIL